MFIEYYHIGMTDFKTGLTSLVAGGELHPDGSGRMTYERSPQPPRRPAPIYQEPFVDPSLHMESPEIKGYVLASIGKLPELRQMERVKILDMCHRYRESIRAALILDPEVPIKPLNEVFDVFTQLSPNQRGQVTGMHLPRLVVTSKNSFAEKIAGMNRFKTHYLSKNKRGGQPLTEIMRRFLEAIESPVENRVEIIEGQPTLLPPTDIPKFSGEIDPADAPFYRRQDFLNYLLSKGMDIVDIHTYTTLQQLGLVDYLEPPHDIRQIVDYYNQSRESAAVTATALADRHINMTDFTPVCDRPVMTVAFYATDDALHFNIARPEDTLLLRPTLPLLSY